MNDPIFSRRKFIGSVGMVAAAMAVPGRLRAAPARFEIVRTPQEWRRRLSPQRHSVLREAKTERAGSSPLDREKRAGIYSCGGCALPLFSSAAKYDSGTGWPSFFAPLRNAVGTREDRELGYKRVEVHCRRCGSHLGHVFDDGPKPTGKRYCMNGLALAFSPK